MTTSFPLAPGFPAAQTTSPDGDWLLGQLREVLDLTSRAAVRRLDPAFWQPRPGSTFRDELANTEVDVHGAPWGPQEPTMAFEMAQLSMLAVEDYLTGIRKLLEPPFPPPAPKLGSAVLCRSALESAGFAFWLMDPQLTVRQRVARTYLVLWDENKTALKNAKAGAPPNIAQAQADLSTLITRIDDLGLARAPKPLSVSGETLPSKTERVTALLAGKVSGGHEVVYSLYSAVAHGEMTGILSRRLAGGWTITPRQLTQNVELAVVAFGQLQQRLCLGGMGSAPDEVANQLWEHNVGRRLLAVRRRLA
ncbi:hypothetical protein [Micromonospora sp. M71_S20]|uniref:hypothetical protein n=1 Tax=Micromonospora sp. M71_S20 TaxID=592872 RepID=UPI0011E58C99|nr:hypothetical protein [Micromonospora sp. M71_S20]